MVGEYATRTHNTRAVFWGSAYATDSLGDIVAFPPQTRQFWNDYDACVNAGGAYGSNPCKRAFASFHTGVINWLFADGSVHSLSTNIDLTVLAAMATIANGEVFTAPF
jgi:prepilin-type processing-associated H-X9-DG protein